MAAESLILGELELNDGESLGVTELTFTPAQKKLMLADNAGADGSALVQESHFTNATFDLLIRVRQTSTADAALEKVGELLDTLQDCERIEGGAPLEWKPKDSSNTLTWYVLSAELLEVPTELSGDLAGWLLKSPLVRLRLTCRPFGYDEEKTAKSSTESGAEPQQVLYVKCGGDVPAEVRAKVTDKSSQPRRFLEWGRDVVFKESENPATLITAKDLVITGFSGSSVTRAGAYPDEAGVGKEKRATAVSQPTVMCGTGSIKNVGSFKVYGRVYTGSTAARFRISYRNGEGPLVPLAFVQPPVLEFSRIYLGEVTFDEAILGTQKAEIRIEVKSSTGELIEVDLNYLELVPSTKGSARVRGPVSNNTTALLAYDTFLQTEGNLAGKTLPLGGEWAEAGDAVRFKVIAAEDLARRTEVSDANLNTGAYAVAGTAEPTNVSVSIDVSRSTLEPGAEGRWGVFARYSNTENWLLAVIQTEGKAVTLRVFKRVTGTVTQLASMTLANFHLSPLSDRVVLSVNDAGGWRAWQALSTADLGTPLLEGTDAVLATGGALAKGKVGFYDAYTSASANTRQFDNFSAAELEGPARVLYSGKVAEIRSEGYFRQDESGTYYGELPPRGSDLYLEPEGDSAAINRLVIVARRNDVEVEADSAVVDKISVEVKVRERFIAPR